MHTHWASVSSPVAGFRLTLMVFTYFLEIRASYVHPSATREPTDSARQRSAAECQKDRFWLRIAPILIQSSLLISLENLQLVDENGLQSFQLHRYLSGKFGRSKHMREMTFRNQCIRSWEFRQTFSRILISLENRRTQGWLKTYRQTMHSEQCFRRYASAVISYEAQSAFGMRWSYSCCEPAFQLFLEQTSIRWYILRNVSKRYSLFRFLHVAEFTWTLSWEIRHLLKLRPGLRSELLKKKHRRASAAVVVAVRQQTTDHLFVRKERNEMIPLNKDECVRIRGKPGLISVLGCSQRKRSSSIAGQSWTQSVSQEYSHRIRAISWAMIDRWNIMIDRRNRLNEGTD